MKTQLPQEAINKINSYKNKHVLFKTKLTNADRIECCRILNIQ